MGITTIQLTSCLAGLEMCLCAVQNSVYQAQSTFLNRSNSRSMIQWLFLMQKQMNKRGSHFY